MEAAHKKLEQHYERAGHSDAYIGQFYASPHKFDMEMQQAAFAWLKQHLG